ncbi:MAG: DPP IV N-terminal domain-containing protein, partial [Rhodanobacteraceae bacterium]
MRHLLLASVLALITTPAMADKLSIDRIFDGGDLSGPTPRALKMSPDGTRVTFIRARPDDQHTFDLWQYKLADKTLSKLVDASELEPDGEQLSRAELARRERARTAGLHGIISYQWSHDGHTLLFPLNGKLYLYDLDSDKDKAVRPLDTGPGEVLDPRISPAGGYVSWVREQNLWVMNLKTGAVRQLTMDGHGTVHNGQAEFVAQEEMERQSGYWWAPDDSAIAYEQYDEAPVPVTQRFEIYADHTTLVEQRYPFAGDPNVTVKLGLVAPEGGDTRWIDLGSDADMYLTRVKWLPGAKRLSYQWMARSQQKLE